MGGKGNTRQRKLSHTHTHARGPHAGPETSGFPGGSSKQPREPEALHTNMTHQHYTPQILNTEDTDIDKHTLPVVGPLRVS